jgi:hypothetical protein
MNWRNLSEKNSRGCFDLVFEFGFWSSLKTMVCEIGDLQLLNKMVILINWETGFDLV